jgi:hypothetical protein
MPEPVTTAAAAAAKALTGNDKTPGLVKRLLGPLADEWGNQLADWAKFRRENVQQVLDAAERKLGDRVEEDAEVSPRIVSRVFEEGSYSNDRIMGEYLGGVLASSRTSDGRDDRGIRFLNLITDMSSYDLRTHFVLYQAARQTYLRCGLDESHVWGYTTSYDLARLKVFVPYKSSVGSMDFTTEDPQEILSGVLFGLDALELVSSWQLSTEAKLQERNLAIPSGALEFIPSPLGIQLFVWAQGCSEKWKDFHKDSIDLDLMDIVIPEGMIESEIPKISAPLQPS